MNIFVQARLSKPVEDYRGFGPGEKGLAYIELRNDDVTGTFVSRVWLHFDWQGDLSYLIELGKRVVAGGRRTVGPIHFEIPNSTVGTRKYKVGIEALDQLYSGAGQ